MAVTAKKDAPSPAAVFHTHNPVSGGYAVSSDATRAAVPEISEAAYVVRAARVTRKGDEIPVLLVRDGAANRALELSAIGAALTAGVITREEIEALWSLKR